MRGLGRLARVCHRFTDETVVDPLPANHWTLNNSIMREQYESPERDSSGDDSFEDFVQQCQSSDHRLRRSIVDEGARVAVSRLPLQVREKAPPSVPSSLRPYVKDEPWLRVLAEALSAAKPPCFIRSFGKLLSITENDGRIMRRAPEAFGRQHGFQSATTATMRAGLHYVCVATSACWSIC